MVGPNVQNSLFSILIRARQYKFILTGDIEKMYRQVQVSDEDRDLQLILWREDESEPIKTLRLNTLTYGTASASYLSTKCLWQVGEECEDAQIKTIIQNDFYVDDLITGADSEEELRYIQKSVASALSGACFPLRKYKTNLPQIFDNSNINSQDSLTLSESSSTLGLGWNPSNDKLHFPVSLPLQNSTNTKVTKRYIMSNSFKIFDPLGLLSPCVILPKIMLQQLWLQKIDWDQPVPDDINNAWHEFASYIPDLTTLQIPRSVLCDLPKDVEMHSFSDASQRAYGACVYIKTMDAENNVSVKLLCAKSKVAPLKPTTIPRLELCAALLAARLCKSVLESLRFTPSAVVHWCDSSVVLSWINSEPSKLKTFAANRIGEILETTLPSSWRYVPTAYNPADLISRGVNAVQLLHSELWWSGPNFLSKDETFWPTLKPTPLESLPEVKSMTVTVSQPLIDFIRYSKLNRIQRSFAYAKRFIHNVKNPNSKILGNLTIEELNDSFNHLCSIAQQQSFPTEYNLLSKGKSLSPKSRILSLSPFFENNLIKVGGRINASHYTYDKRHPILLDPRHHLCRLIFAHEHCNNMHAGPQLLLAIIRERVWPIDGRRAAQRTVYNCVRCRRVQGKTLCPKMGDLPAQRITADFPFVSVGLDFAGPFLILNRKGRGAKLVKMYLCLFVCLRYKCLHLEAVSDLTKNSFIMTLRRFVARRGRPAEIFCDNGRNFIAGAKELNSFLKENVESLSAFATQEGIKFNFTPAYAPHFGGIWEAGVKSAKYHVKRIMGNTHLTFEEITTLFAQVEAILNSRPLCPLSSSPDDLLFLSPGHFLIGRPLRALPTPTLEDCNESYLQRYARVEKLRQSFWKRWQGEYIGELQQRCKWRVNKADLKVEDMVLIHEENTPPLCWRLGRVLRLFPGPDGVSRVADVNTTRGTIRRPLTRLCPLPTPEDLCG
ncbi:uncharacterized protein LOC126379650 [Pectinophora gossypiella]|uniref:uncharacterized protein LOC126379650 n=1 Tax=Pectinophora gossypiella TaxID=13191 RepID=UPI00214EA548|nr:uncharacterized protein LOC126379650 [Pectinophora gossypiella]